VYLLAYLLALAYVASVRRRTMVFDRAFTAVEVDKPALRRVGSRLPSVRTCSTTSATMTDHVCITYAAPQRNAKRGQVPQTTYAVALGLLSPARPSNAMPVTVH
jgi:hypothetical protein